MIAFDVLGSPAPKGSPRPVIRGGRAFLTPSHSATGQRRLKDWNSAVRAQAVDAIVDLGDSAPSGPLFVGVPLAMELTFRMVRPAGHWGKRGLKPSAPSAPATKPDIDKLTRSTLDCLTGLVFDDDSRVVELVVRKVYADPGREGARIVVRALGELVSRGTEAA
jgi:Holliday junction resolvase RusA-like endonuclease